MKLYLPKEESLAILSAHYFMNFRPRSRREFLQLMGVCAMPLGAISCFTVDRMDELERPLEFDTERMVRLQNDPSEVVLIGNSMIYCRLNTHYLPELLAPLNVEMATEGGTRSLQWFLWFKNYVAEVKPAPKVVFIFYRDYDFARVDFRVAGTYLQTIRKSMRKGDEKYLWIARGQSQIRGAVGWLADTFNDHPQNTKKRKRVDDAAMDVAALAGDLPEPEVRKYVTGAFGMDKLRSDIQDAGVSENDNLKGIASQFTADADKNYLSHFDQVASEHGIKLVFYRVRRRPDDANDVRQTAALATYTRDFRNWITARGHVWVDETDDQKITPSMFRDGDHLLRESYNQYTEMFVERIRHLLPTPYTPEEIAAGKAAARNPQIP